MPAVRAVPVVSDWRALTRDEFVSRADAPMIFAGLGAGSRAAGWDREFFRAFGDEPVQIHTRVSEVRPKPDTTYDGRECVRQTVPLREFIAALDAGEEGVYAAEWYLFKEHPDLLRHAIEAFPDFLLDDWLESVPPPLRFDSNTRTNVYWGATGSVTPVHYDSLNACTWNLTLKGVKRWLLFSARELQVPAPRCWEELRARGLLTEDGLFTPDTVQAYLDAPPGGFPPVTFYAADVGLGDAIYVPWRWAHQVENVGESIAVSRYYVSRENYAAAVEFFESTRGSIPALLLRTVMGTRAARAFFRRPGVRRWLAHGRSAAVPRFLMRRAMGQGRR
jgi:Cupin-like domain